MDSNQGNCWLKLWGQPDRERTEHYSGQEPGQEHFSSLKKRQKNWNNEKIKVDGGAGLVHFSF